MSKTDNGQILLNCFFERTFFNLSKNFSSLNENTNFVFLFAEADETRFAIQEENSIILYEITMPEDEDDGDKDEDSDDDDYRKVAKPPKEPHVQEIWRVEGLEAVREQSRETTEKAYLDRQIHSAVSI
jgi:hypothetical protein